MNGLAAVFSSSTCCLGAPETGVVFEAAFGTAYGVPPLCVSIVFGPISDPDCGSIFGSSGGPKIRPLSYSAGVASMLPKREPF